MGEVVLWNTTSTFKNVRSNHVFLSIFVACSAATVPGSDTLQLRAGHAGWKPKHWTKDGASLQEQRRALKLWRSNCLITTSCDATLPEKSFSPNLILWKKRKKSGVYIFLRVTTSWKQWLFRLVFNFARGNKHCDLIQITSRTERAHFINIRLWRWW